LADSYENGATTCAWITVVHALSEGLCLVLCGCQEYSLAVSEQCKNAFPSSDANVDAFYKQAAAEEKAGTRCCNAAEQLRKAYGVWSELRA